MRVVSNVKKRAEVKPRFLDAFQQAENFPTDLPYTQKVGPVILTAHACRM